MIRTLAAVFAGGMAGTGARLALDALLPAPAGSIPWSTLIINLSGSLLLGVLVSALGPRVGPILRAGLGAGLLGSYTTFSAIAVTVVQLDALSALMYLLGSILFGFAAAAAGLRLGGRFAPKGHTA